MNWSVRALWQRLAGAHPTNGRAVTEARKSASAALSAAEGAADEVARAVRRAGNVARSTDRFVREAERSFRRPGGIT